MNVTGKSILPKYDMCSDTHLRPLTMEDIYAQECETLVIAVYGTVVPVLAVLVTLMNLVIISIFVKPHIRSHTSFILSLIAVADIFNIVCPASVYVYYFTFGKFGGNIPYQFCRWTFYLGSVFTRFFNVLSLWFTVLLAFVRYRCIMSPLKARNLHNWKNIVGAIMIIVVLALCLYVPTLSAWDFQPFEEKCQDGQGICTACILSPTKYMFSDPSSVCTFSKALLWLDIITNSFLPCILLLFLDFTILSAFRKAEVCRSSLRRSGTKFGKPVKNKDADDNEKQTLVDSNGHLTTPNNDGNVDGDSSKQTKDLEKFRQQTGTAVSHHFHLHVPSCPKKARKLSFSDEQVRDHHSLPKDSNADHDNAQSSVTKPTKVTAQMRRKAFSNSKTFNQSSQSSDSAFDKLNNECRRTSRLIILVVTIICTHEIPLGIIRCHALATSNDSLPPNFFGCASVFLSLWQYVTYPLIFLIYCCMSSAFREEMWLTITCRHIWSHATHAQSTNTRKNVFMSPCSIRRTFSRGTGRLATANQMSTNHCVEISQAIMEDENEMVDFEETEHDLS